MTTNEADYKCLGDLLDDAQLLHMHWDASTASLALTFNCMRSDEAGEELEDPVTVLLQGVRFIGALCRPLDPAKKSSAKPLPTLTLADLDDNEMYEEDPFLNIDSKQRRVSISTFGPMNWLFGEECETKHFAHLSLTYSLEPVPENDNILYIGFTTLATKPVSLATWKEQFAAYWECAMDWVEEGEEEEEDNLLGLCVREPVEFSEKMRDSVLQTGDTPEHLVAPIRDFYLSKYTKDWALLARVYPNLDLTEEERVEELVEEETILPFAWDFSRKVLSWWEDGERAYVEVSGYVNTVDDDMEEDEEEDEEGMTKFGLIRHDNRWVIWLYTEDVLQGDDSQGEGDIKDD